LHCPLGTSKDILKSTTEETFKHFIKKLKISAVCTGKEQSGKTYGSIINN
jgi:hypothetical protein